MQTQVTLWIPFLVISGALINVLEGMVTLRVGDENVTLYVLACNDPIPIYPMTENAKESPPRSKLLKAFYDESYIPH